MHTPITSRIPRGRAGFALPAAIFALVVVAVLVTGGLYVTSQESRIGLATERSTQAFYTAESAVHELLGDWNPANANLEIWGAEQVIDGTNAEGRWQVRISRIDNDLYLMRSSGAVPTVGGAEAVRQLGLLVRHVSVELDPPAALTTRGDVRVAGSAQIRGEDSHPWDSERCPDPLQDTPGVITDETGEVTTSGQGTVSGDPDYVQDPDIDEDDFTTFGDLTWDDLVQLATIVHPPGGINTMGPSINAAGQCDTTNPLNWGDPLSQLATDVCEDYFPIIYVPGSASIQSGGVGQGILLVEGDLDLRGGFQFFGIIIVQGSFEVQGGGAQGPRISGGVMARNAHLETQSYVGSSIVNNSRCAIQRSIDNNSALNRGRPLPERGWVDLTGASF